MQCRTVKPGVECIFMKKYGCAYPGGRCSQIVDQCGDCERVEAFPSGRYCLSFTEPRKKWARGICSLATHVKREYHVSRRKMNPLKASKRRLNGPAAS